MGHTDYLSYTPRTLGVAWTPLMDGWDTLRPAVRRRQIHAPVLHVANSLRVQDGKHPSDERNSQRGSQRPAAAAAPAPSPSQTHPMRHGRCSDDHDPPITYPTARTQPSVSPRKSSTYMGGAYPISRRLSLPPALLDNTDVRSRRRLSSNHTPITLRLGCARGSRYRRASTGYCTKLTIGSHHFCVIAKLSDFNSADMLAW
jgi:hypothetical protein